MGKSRAQRRERLAMQRFIQGSGGIGNDQANAVAHRQFQCAGEDAAMGGYSCKHNHGSGLQNFFPARVGAHRIARFFECRFPWRRIPAFSKLGKRIAVCLEPSPEIGDDASSISGGMGMASPADGHACASKGVEQGATPGGHSGPCRQEGRREGIQKKALQVHKQQDRSIWHGRQRAAAWKPFHGIEPLDCAGIQCFHGCVSFSRGKCHEAQTTLGR